MGESLPMRSRWIGPSGHTYGAVVVRLDSTPRGRPVAHSDVLARLAGIRFSGWVAPAEQGWVVAVAAEGNGTIAAGRRGVLGVGEQLALDLGATTVSVRIVHDRQLLVAMWGDADELGRYLSDPSYGLGDDEVLSDPFGVEHADAFAAAVGRPEIAGDLTELLAEELDHDSVSESERLAGVLRLLGLPGWVVAVPSLPRDIPTGPRARDLIRLGAGAQGLQGRLLGRAAHSARRHRRPPPAVPDPPRGDAGMDPWLF
ncbi:MAG: hypothetical protein ACXV3S_05850 [Kineosporiaceae bacterium]